MKSGSGAQASNRPESLLGQQLPARGGGRYLKTSAAYGSIAAPGLIKAALLVALILSFATLNAVRLAITVDRGFSEGGSLALRVAIIEGVAYASVLLIGGYVLIRHGKYYLLATAATVHIIFVIGLVAQTEGLGEKQLLSSALWSGILLALLGQRSSRQFYQSVREVAECERSTREPTFIPRQWWSNHELVNGVFKGGGAKGIAYAGALEAMDERGLWFGSVAGTSAGAITATLVACGCNPREMRSQVPALLKSIRQTRIRMILGTRSTLFDSRSLRLKLEQILCDCVGRPFALDSPVTFQELHNAYTEKISLYVVALDLSRAAPVVFSVHTTPDVSVSGAVMASSAIPVGFPSVRGIFRSGKEVWVQRLVDGGAWANLPRFVYYDPSFAAWILQINPKADLHRERERPTVGFALGIDDTTIIQPDMLTLDSTGVPELDRGTTQESSSRWMWVLGEVFSSQMSRFLIALSLLAIAALLFVNTHAAVSSFWNLMPDEAKRFEGEFKPMVAILYVGTVVMGCILPFIAVCFSRPLGDVLIPAGRAALAVGTGVAPWVGAASDDHIVRLDPGKLRTTDFAPKVADQNAAISDARLRTLDYIDRYLRVRATADSPVTVDAVDPPYVESRFSDPQKLSRVSRWIAATSRLLVELTRLYMWPMVTVLLVVIALVMFVHAGNAILYRGKKDLDYWSAVALALVSLPVISWLVTTIMMRWQRNIARSPAKYTRVTRVPGLAMIIFGFLVAIAIPLNSLELSPFKDYQKAPSYQARVIEVEQLQPGERSTVVRVMPTKSDIELSGSPDVPRKVTYHIDASHALPEIGDIIDVRVPVEKKQSERKESGGTIVVLVLAGLWLVRAGLWPLRVIGRDRGLLSIKY